MGVPDYSLYLKSKNCCKKIVEVCTPGPQGPQGPQGIAGNSKSALLFYNDLTFTVDDILTATYNNSITSNNGFERFIINNLIDFSSLNSLVSSNNCFIEIYSHCDAIAGSSGSSNFVTIDLSGVNIVPNSLGIVDIDTRSVEKGAEQHLSFGPALYKLVNHNTANNTLCINTNNTYGLRVSTGRPYDLKEIRLSIKVILIES